MSDGLDVLLIRVGSRTFGVPLEHIRHVAAIPPDFAAQGVHTESHLVFAGTPLPYISLWDHFLLESCYNEYVQIEAMLPQRCQDHLDWIGALEDCIRTGSPFSKARDHRECAFGKWFYSYKTENLQLSVFLSQFEHPHAMVHQLADRLLGMAESGKKEDALARLQESKNTTLKRLLELFDFTATLVHDLQRRVALISTQGGQELALGADSVIDIIKVPLHSIKQTTSSAKMGALGSISALLVLENQTIAPLLNINVFYRRLDD